MFVDISRCVELEVECQAANHITTLMVKTSISDDNLKANGPTQKSNYRRANKQKGGSKFAPKANRAKKSRGNRAIKKNVFALKCFSYGEKGHLCVQPISIYIYISSHILIAHSLHIGLQIQD